MPHDYSAPAASLLSSASRLDADTHRLIEEEHGLREGLQAASVELARSESLPPFAEPPGQSKDLENALTELQIFVGSAVMRFAAERVATVASTDVPILLLGETGTGKELFAKLAHRLSGRPPSAFVPVNCAAIPKDLMESYLFGCVKGAFTGATSSHIGKFEQAHGGTLFLDEIGELTTDAQAKLLRVLQDGNIEPVGSHQTRQVDVRIVAATNRNLQDELTAARFRKDLYFRLGVVEVLLPPLRERREEIPELAVAILGRINQRLRHQRRLTKDALSQLGQHDWPGNVRELEKVLQESVIFSKTDVLGPEDLLIKPKPSGHDLFRSLPEPAPGFELKAFLAQVKTHLIKQALSKCHGNQSQAAGLLGISKQVVNKFLVNANGKPA